MDVLLGKLICICLHYDKGKKNNSIFRKVELFIGEQ